MDFDGAKENIQPLASGRNAERLEVALNAESQRELHEQLAEQCREFERGIDSYVGDDPLELWYEYIQWIEQSYPKSGKETPLMHVISSCLATFENDDRYKQDRRLIKLFIKYIDSEDNPHEFYEMLYNAGVGTMVADLYLCWAHYYDYNDNFEKAESVYRKGLDARAQPLDQLEQAHKQFGFSMSQRLLHKDAMTRERFLLSMDEQRLALTSLRAHKHRHVGSIRTGAAVRSHNPGRIEQQPHSSRTNPSNRSVQVYEDENRATNAVMAGVQTPIRGAVGGSDHHQSVVQAILSSAKKRENSREPGPWSQAKLKTSRSIVGSSVPQKLPFNIMNDDDVIPLLDEENMFKRGIQLPAGFVKQNLQQTEFDFPLHRDENNSSKAMAGYNKFMLFPSADKCFSPEELMAYRWLKKRNVANDFTRKQDAIWDCGYGIPIRLPPHFCQKNEKQTDDMELEPFKPKDVIDDGTRRFSFNIDHIYTGTADGEYSMEELLQSRWLNGELASQRENDMDLTRAFNRRESVFVASSHRRSMALGGRKSILPAITDMPRKSILRKSIAPPIFDTEPSTSRASEQAVGESSANYKRKSVSVAPAVDQEMKSPPLFKRKCEEAPAAGPVSTFAIFEDDRESAPKEDKHLFKAPQLPPATRPRASSIYDLGDDNDDCTTQMFNFNIKAQSVSTPISTPKPLRYPHSDQIQQRGSLFGDAAEAKSGPLASVPKEPEPVSGPDAPVPSEPEPESVPVAPVRQPFGCRMLLDDAPSPEMDINRHKLSAILETTEDTNTISSAATTKLSLVDEASSTNSTSSTSSTLCATRKSSPLATIHEIAAMPKSCATADVAMTRPDGCEPVPEPRITNATVVAAPALPLGAFEDNVAHYIAGLSATKATDLEAPSMCPLNLLEDKTVTIPAVFTNRNQTIEAPLSKSIIPIFTIPPLDSTMDQLAPPKPSASEGGKFAILVDDADVLSRPVADAVAKPKTIVNETADKSVFNFANESSFMPPPKSPSGMPMSHFDSVSKLNLSSEPTLPFDQLYPLIAPKPTIADRSEFLIFKDENDEAASPVATSVQMDPTFNEKSAIDDYPMLSFNQRKETLETAAATCLMPNTAVADIDEEFYRMIQSPVTRSSIKPKQSVANEPDVRASIAKDCSSSLLKPMKEISLTRYQDIDRSVAQLHSQATVPLAHFSFSEDNPNTELFSLHMAAIKNSTLLERLPSPTPNATLVGTKEAQVSNQDKGTSNMDDEFYALISSPIPMPRSKSLVPFKASVIPTAEKNASSFNAPLQSNDIFNISGIEFKDSERKLMSFGSDPVDSPIPQIQISAPKTIRPSSFNRMAANYTIPDSPEVRVEPVTNVKPSRETIAYDNDDCSVIIIEATEDLAITTKQCAQDQSSMNVSGASSFRNQSLTVGKASFSIEYSGTQHIDPFDLKTHDSILTQVDFVDYIRKLDNVDIVKRVRALQPDTEIAIGDKEFHIIKQIGQGSFGFVYSGKCLATKKMYALKQERPANLWEFYISLELRSRIEDQNILSGFLAVDFALIGGNSSVFASEYCAYGSIIDICNKHKQKTFLCLDELIVMVLANQMLMIVDHMHASSIIHADIKPDNFLVMNKLNSGNRERITLKLIDYGQSIDLKFYDKRQTFYAKLETKNFICTEMMDDRPWTFQIDLFCLASTIYSMLCGKYMDVKKTLPNSLRAYTLKEPLPANLDRELWMNVLHTLINVRDCDSMPNLQSLRLTIKEAIHSRERFLDEKIRTFNSIIDLLS